MASTDYISDYLVKTLDITVKQQDGGYQAVIGSMNVKTEAERDGLDANRDDRVEELMKRKQRHLELEVDKQDPVYLDYLDARMQTLKAQAKKRLQ